MLSSDLATVKRYLDAQESHQRAQAADLERRRKLAAMDPFSAEYQKALEGIFISSSCIAVI